MKEDLLWVAYDDDGEYPVLIVARSRNGVTVVINQKNGDEAREFYKTLTEGYKGRYTEGQNGFWEVVEGREHE